MSEDDTHRIFEQPRRCVSIVEAKPRRPMHGNDTGIQV
jgi:hypothetical protein